MGEQMKAPTEPNPKDWLTQEKLNDAREKFSSSKQFLEEAGLLDKALNYCIQVKIAEDISLDNEEEIMKAAVDKWRKSNPKVEVEDEELRRKLKIQKACLEWCKTEWSHTIDTVYLQQKSNLDKASCRIIRIRDKNIASEIYFRIKNVEVSFEQAAVEYGEGAEKMAGGLIPFQSLEKMPLGLAPLLERLEVGELSPPLKIGKGYCIVKLIKFKSSSLDSETVNGLHYEQLRLWIDKVVQYVSSRIK